MGLFSRKNKYKQIAQPIQPLPQTLQSPQQSEQVQQPIQPIQQFSQAQLNMYVVKVQCENCLAEQEIQIEKGTYVDDWLKKAVCFNCALKELKRIDN